jgi:HEAT repeat protein
MTDDAKADTAASWPDDAEERRLRVRDLGGAIDAKMFVDALGDDDWRVRREAVMLSPRLVGRAEYVDALLVALNEKENISLRNAVVEALSLLGKDARRRVVAICASLDADARKLAVEVLASAPDAEEVDALVRLLDDEDPNVRVAAIEALGNAYFAGEYAARAAAAALAKVLERKTSPDVQIALLQSLRTLGAPLVAPLLARLVEEPLVSAFAVRAATGTDDPATLALLVAQLRPTSVLLDDATAALGQTLEPRLRGRSDKARPIIDEAAADVLRRIALQGPSRSLELRCYALLLLALRAEGTDVALSLLADEQAFERVLLALRCIGAPALRALALALDGDLGPSALAALAALESDVDEGAARAVAAFMQRAEGEALMRALGILTSASSRGVDVGLPLQAIRPLVASADPFVARLAAMLLASRVELGLLRQEDLGDVASPRERAAAELGEVRGGKGTEGADARLGELVGNDDPLVRELAVRALGALAQGAGVEALAFALADEERAVATSAIEALAEAGATETLVELATQSHDPQHRQVALRVLGRRAPESLAHSARALVDDPDPRIVCAAVDAFAPIVALARDAIYRALDRPEPECIGRALRVLSGDGDVRTVANVGRLLESGDLTVRRMAAEVLATARSEHARALLRSRLEREEEPSARRALLTSLAFRPPVS